MGVTRIVPEDHESAVIVLVCEIRGMQRTREEFDYEGAERSMTGLGDVFYAGIDKSIATLEKTIALLKGETAVGADSVALDYAKDITTEYWDHCSVPMAKRFATELLKLSNGKV